MAPLFYFMADSQERHRFRLMAERMREGGGGCVCARIYTRRAYLSHSSPVSFSPIILAEVTTIKIFGMVLNELSRMHRGNARSRRQGEKPKFTSSKRGGTVTEKAQGVVSKREAPSVTPIPKSKSAFTQGKPTAAWCSAGRKGSW